MAECEICGREARLYLVEIDKARLNVCFDCSKSGKLLEAPRPQPQPRKKQETIAKKQLTELDVVMDYGRRIREAREKMRITRAVLAEMINEKESFLDRVESEKVLPPDTLARKLEKTLNITLYEEVGVGSASFKGTGPGTITLGDIIQLKRKGAGNGN